MGVGEGSPRIQVGVGVGGSSRIHVGVGEGSPRNNVGVDEGSPRIHVGVGEGLRVVARFEFEDILRIDVELAEFRVGDEM